METSDGGMNGWMDGWDEEVHIYGTEERTLCFMYCEREGTL